MTPTEADSVIAAIKARLTRLAWAPEVWADFRAAMLRVKIDDTQGVAVVSEVILTNKTVPSPAHFLEGFKAAQGEKPQTCSPAVPGDGYRGENWHPRAWGIVRGWTWMRAEENWDKLPAMLAEYAREFGVDAPDWEAIIAPDAHERFSNGAIENLGLWINRRTRKTHARGSFDLWAAKQREAQERRVRVIRALREQVAGGSHG